MQRMSALTQCEVIGDFEADLQIATGYLSGYRLAYAAAVAPAVKGLLKEIGGAMIHQLIGLANSRSQFRSVG